MKTSIPYVCLLFWLSGQYIAGQQVDESQGVVEQHVVIEHGDTAFDAVITKPAKEKANGSGVLLIGGGVGNDLDWSVPGKLHFDGNDIQLTLTGAPHSDGPLLAKAFAERGFIVLRYSTLAKDDPLADQWPLRATARSFDELTQLASSALSILRKVEGLKAGSISLVGHSLGAARAITIANENDDVRTLVLLSPAEVLLSQRTPASLKQSSIVFLGALLSKRSTKVLAVFGSEDRSPAVDQQAVDALVGRNSNLEVKLFDELGHQLGSEARGYVGPMSPRVLQFTGEWLSNCLSR